MGTPLDMHIKGCEWQRLPAFFFSTTPVMIQDSNVFKPLETQRKTGFYLNGN
jgi:hypothetical protein